MTTFLLVPGAGGRASCWSRVVPLLETGGHRAVAVDLPAGDESAGWAEHLDAALAPLDAVAAGDRWGATGQPAAAAEAARADGRPEAFDAVRDLFHDVPPDVVAEALEAGEPPQSSTPFTQPWPGEAWPGAAPRVLAGRDDRMFPPAFQRRVVSAVLR